MKHALLKFNHGVEIGARLAYLGHYKRTGDRKILEIAQEEAIHQMFLDSVLLAYDQRSNWIIDTTFTLVGNTVGWFCAFSPLFMLDFVARSMEFFAVINYNYLARVYPELQERFTEMADTEKRHKEYFKRSA